MTKHDLSKIAKILKDYDSDKTTKLIKDYKDLKINNKDLKTEFNTFDQAMVAIVISLLFL